jgi:hypothetical protein
MQQKVFWTLLSSTPGETDLHAIEDSSSVGGYRLFVSLGLLCDSRTQDGGNDSWFQRDKEGTTIVRKKKREMEEDNDDDDDDDYIWPSLGFLSLLKEVV